MGCSQHLARPFPFHPVKQHTGKKCTQRKQRDPFLVNCSQHICEQAVLAGLCRSHTVALSQWPLDFIWPRSQICCPVGTKTTLFRIQPPGILEKSHFTKSAIHHPQTPGSVSPCQEQGQIFRVIGCCLCNLMPLSSWRQEVR